MAAITLLLQHDENIDKMLASASGAEEWFEMFDEIGRNVKDEYGRRVGANAAAEVA